MSGFNLTDVSVAQDGNNDEVETTHTPKDLAEQAPFEPNNLTDNYISGGDWKTTVKTILQGEGLEEPNVNVFNDNLSDLEYYLDKYSDAEPVQKLWIVAALFKGEIGDLQRELADNSAGLEDGEKPRESAPEDDRFYYADVYRDLPSIEWEGLDGGEIDAINDYDIEDFEGADSLGFDPEVPGPKIPVVNGERLPIIAESDEDVQAVIDQISTIDEDELSYWDGDEVVNGATSSSGGSSSDDDADLPTHKELDDMTWQELSKLAGKDHYGVFESGDDTEDLRRKLDEAGYEPEGDTDDAQPDEPADSESDGEFATMREFVDQYDLESASRQEFALDAMDHFEPEEIKETADIFFDE